MKTIRNAAACGIALLVALVCSSAIAEVESDEQLDAGYNNHYILTCVDTCMELVTAGLIGPGFSGAWYNRAQSGHGLFVEILPDNRIQVLWFAFNPAGSEQAWFVGVGTYNGNKATVDAVVQPTGGRWIPNFDPGRVTVSPWGSLKLAFTDCNHGVVEFVSTNGYGSGTMKLARLTQPAGLACP